METAVVIEDSLAFAVLPFEKDTLLAHIQAHHPMVRMYALQQETARKALVANALEGKPSFGVGVDYLWVDGRTDAVPLHNGRDIVQVNATLSIPLYRGKYTAKANEETFRIAALEQQKLATASSFQAMIERAYVRFETAVLLQDLYIQQIQTTKAAIRVLETNYSTQKSSFDELLQLERELIDYDLKILQAVVESHRAQASIERYIVY